MAALRGLRVLEIGCLPAAAYTARLLADFGADVVRVEPGGGDPLRDAEPRLGPQAPGAWYAWLNFGKRCVTGLSADALAALAAECDVVITSAGANALSELPSLGHDIVHIDVSWFSRTGPYARFAATDATCRALAGNTFLVGPTEGPPISAPDYQAAIAGGLWGMIGACAALLARERDGGRKLEASVHEACVTLAEYQVAESLGAGQSQERLGLNKFAPTYPLGIYPAADGFVGVTLVTPAQWRAFCAMLDLDDLARDETLTTSQDRLPRADELEARFLPKLREKPAAHWFAEGLRRRIPLVVVPTMDMLASSSALRERGAIVPVRAGSIETLAPGSPLKLMATPPRAGGALQESASAAWLPREERPRFAASHAAAGALPLAGVRIVDFTMGWAGPLCTRTMADLGADVVKIEGCSYPDWWRGVDRRAAVVREKLYEKQSRFAVMSRGKRGITLDLTTPEGVRIAKALVATADAVVDNYSVDVLPKFGLGPDVLRSLKPGLVTLSMSAFGASSAWRDCRAYGSTLEQGSGLPSVIGRPDDPPVMGHPAFGDPVGGLNGAAALLVALLHARRTGEGQHIDLAQVECMMPNVAPWLMTHTATGETPARGGNGHPTQAPHGLFRCAGEDRWIAIAVRDTRDWHALCDVISRPDLRVDAALASPHERRRQAGRIDAAIGAWTRIYDPDDVMAMLQHAGVPAGVVRRPFDLLHDPHLVERRFWQQLDRAYTGPFAQPSAAIRQGDDPFAVLRPAPTLGQYNHEVLRDVLGMSTSEIAALEEAGVIGTELLVEDAPARASAA